MAFGFTSIKHAFAWIGNQIAKGLVVVDLAAPIVEGVTLFVDPPAVLVERAAFAALGNILAEIHTASTTGVDLVNAKGLNITLDAQEILAFLQIWAMAQQGLIQTGIIPSIKTK